MELYTNSQPILIGERVTNLFNSMLENIKMENRSIFGKFYDDYVCPNISIIIVIILFIWFLMYMRKRKSKMTENYNNIINKSIDPIMVSENDQYVRGLRVFGGIDHPKERIARPTFNPSIPVSRQHSYVNYLPDEIPVDINGQLQNNVIPMEYIAPNNNTNNFQYGGPIYRLSDRNTSNDMHNNFVDANKQNLMEFDDLLQQRTDVY